MASTALAGVTPAPVFAQNLVVDDTQTINTTVTLDTSDEVIVGSTVGSNGTLTIESGGALSNGGDARIGDSGTGTVTVTGTGTWINTNGRDHIVGQSGTGTLNIENGGTVEGAFGVIAFASSSTGVATVTGSGSTWTMSEAFTVGRFGNGTLTIFDGGEVSSFDGFIGSGSGSTGTVIVTGAGSNWTNTSDLTVGEEGIGTLNIENGGSVGNADGYIGRASGSNGTATVTGAGSSWTSSGILFVGAAGTGTLNVENGGTVSNTDGVIGFDGSATGTVTVTGAGSSWTSSSNLSVGEQGTGTLTVESGGAVSNADGFIGFSSGSTGTVTVTGAGSTWTMSGRLEVGSGGTGALTIADGGAVSNGTNFGIIGSDAGAIGSVTVTGAGSTFTNTGLFVIGRFGNGTLNIENGGVVIMPETTVGAFVGSTGAITVKGAGSSWTPDSLLIGSAGSGTLTIADGGVVDTGPFNIAADASSNGTLNIGAAAADSATGAGTLNTATVSFGAGAGTINFNHTGTNYDFDAAITGNGTLNHLAGVTNLTADSSAFAGTTNITGGTLRVNNALGGTLNISGGAIGGTGTLGTLNVQSGATLTPGNSIGTLNVTNITIAAGSTYEVEVNSAGQSDLINATGTATINGGAVKVLAFPDFALGTAYTIVTAGGGVTGTFDSASYGSGSLFIAPTLTYDANNAFVTLAQTTSFAEVAETPNQIAAAGGAQSLGGGTLFSAIALLGTADEANDAFDAISGEIHASTKTALLEDSRFAREAALDRLRVALGGAGTGAGQETLDGATLWAQGFGSWSRRNGDGNAAALDRSIGGLFMGADAEITDNVTLGLMGSYSRAALSVDGLASSATADSYTLGAYAGGAWDAVSLKGGVAHSWHSLEMSRSAAFTGFSDSLGATYNARTFQAYTEAAYSIDAGNARFEPFANLTYVSLGTDGFTEAGGAAALTSASQVSNAVFTTIGIRGEAPVALGETTATLSGGIGWRHAFGDTPTATHSFVSGGDAFTVAGVPLARDTLVFDAGLEVNLTEDAIFGISYNGQLGSGVSDHGAKASLNVRF